MLPVDRGSDGGLGRTMVWGPMGSKGAPSRTVAPEEARLHFEGQAVFKIAVQGIAGSATRALERAGLGTDEVDVVIPHQANARIIDAATRRLGIDPERVFQNIEHFGNTAAASIPIALHDALEAGRIAPGDIVVLTAFGGGVTRGPVVTRGGDRVGSLGTPPGGPPSPAAPAFAPPPPNLDFFAPDAD